MKLIFSTKHDRWWVRGGNYTAHPAFATVYSDEDAARITQRSFTAVPVEISEVEAHELAVGRDLLQSILARCGDAQ